MSRRKQLIERMIAALRKRRRRLVMLVALLVFVALLAGMLSTPEQSVASFTPAELAKIRQDVALGGEISALGISNNKRLVAAGRMDGLVLLFHTNQPGKAIVIDPLVHAPYTPVSSVTFTAADTCIDVQGEDGVVVTVALSNQRVLFRSSGAEVEWHPPARATTARSSNGLAARDDGSTVWVTNPYAPGLLSWTGSNRPDGPPSCALGACVSDGADGEAGVMMFSPDNTTLLIGDFGGGVYIWPLRNKAPTKLWASAPYNSA